MNHENDVHHLQHWRNANIGNSYFESIKGRFNHIHPRINKQTSTGSASKDMFYLECNPVLFHIQFEWFTASIHLRVMLTVRKYIHHGI